MGNGWFETVAEARRRSRKRLPKSVFMALVAGSEHGLTLRDNVEAFGEIGFAPHVAGLSARYNERLVRLVAENLARYVEGRPLLNLVDRQRGY